MDIGVELLRLRHMLLDWVSHLVRTGSRIVTELYKAMVPLSIRQNCAWIRSLKQSYGDRRDHGLQSVPIGYVGFVVLSDGLAPSPVGGNLDAIKPDWPKL